MHYLHPRSRTTGTLFTGTLAVSFLVVALPHLLPCPADRRQFADTIEMPDGTVRRRRRRQQQQQAEAVPGSEDGGVPGVVQVEVESEGRPKRECPVPKPGGLVGRVMGFERTEREVPAEVVVQELVKGRRGLGRGGDGEGKGP